MALPTTGPIRFSDLRTEFAGNAGAISISDYRASYEADTRTKVFTVEIGNTSPLDPNPAIYAINRGSTYFSSPEGGGIYKDSLYLSPGQTLFAWGFQNRPIYLSSTNTANTPPPGGNIVAGSNPFNTGITTPKGNGWFLKWDTTGITVSGTDPGVIGYLYCPQDSSYVTIYQVPRPKEKVFRIPSQLTLSWSNTLQGGNTATLANNAATGTTRFDTKNYNTQVPGLLQPGKTISIEITAQAMSNLAPGGSYLYSMFPIYTTTGNVAASYWDAGYRGISLGTLVFVRWGSNQGGGGNYLGTPNPNTASGVGNVLSNTAPSGGVAPDYTSNASHTGFRLQTSRSGTKIYANITNVSGNTYYINNWTTVGTGGNASPYAVYWRGSDNVYRYTVDVTSNWSMPVQTEKYGMPYAPAFNQTFNATGSDTNATGYVVTVSEGANVSTNTQDFVDYVTDDYYWRWQRNLRAVGNRVEIYPSTAANSYSIVASTDANGNRYATNRQTYANIAYGTTDPEFTFTVTANPGANTVGFWNQNIPMRTQNVSLSSYYSGNSAPYSFP